MKVSFFTLLFTGSHSGDQDISNSIHAIEEKGDVSRGVIKITVDREGHEQALIDLSNVNDYFIKSFIVADNGVGFDEANYKSFLTAESEYKVEKGAKGIGRFVCLKAFKKIEYTSNYINKKGDLEYREFSFSGFGKDKLNQSSEKNSSIQTTGTTVVLNTYYDEYKITCPKSIEEIAENIIEHFLIYFIENKCPTIILNDTNNTLIVLNDRYAEDVAPHINKNKFSVKNQDFLVNILKLESSEKKHSVHYCGNSRDVISESMSKYVPDLVYNVFFSGEENSYIKVYITGQYLDDNVGNERTKFNFPDHDDEALYSFIITFDNIKDKVKEQIEEVLQPQLTILRAQKLEAVKKHVDERSPEFKVVMKYRTGDVSKLPANLNGEKLDVELFKLQQRIELETKELGNKVLNNNNFENAEEFKNAYTTYLEKANDIGKSNLVKYTIHRRAIIDLFEKFLKPDDNGKFQQEKTIHEIFFPIRKESDEIRQDQQNLWLIDERLTYHFYLASDKPISDMHPISGLSTTDRPDLFIFNSSFAFVEDSEPFNSFIIVEFKKPERSNYNDNDSKNNPVDQVIDYISKLRSGHARDRTNRFINISDKDKIPFYAYIICDFNPNLKTILTARDYTPTVDGMGFFYFHRQLNAYIEVISYPKLLKDAKKRNKILFDKLGIAV